MSAESSSDDNVSNWTVKKLKNYLSEHNIDASNCVEKSDLVKLVIKHQTLNNSLNWESIPVGPLSCNMVLLFDANTRKGVVVDPGGDADKIIQLVESKGVEILQILVTHAHFDHILAAGEIKNRWPRAQLSVHQLDAQLFEMLPLQLQLFGMQRFGNGNVSVPKIDCVVDDAMQKSDNRESEVELD
jgi:hypothetical protein